MTKTNSQWSSKTAHKLQIIKVSRSFENALLTWKMPNIVKSRTQFRKLFLKFHHKTSLEPRISKPGFPFVTLGGSKSETRERSFHSEIKENIVKSRTQFENYFLNFYHETSIEPRSCRNLIPSWCSSPSISNFEFRFITRVRNSCTQLKWQHEEVMYPTKIENVRTINPKKKKKPNQDPKINGPAKSEEDDQRITKRNQ